jgi:CBS domain-containing protein
MTSDVVVRADDPMARLVELMDERRIRRVPVVVD